MQFEIKLDRNFLSARFLTIQMDRQEYNVEAIIGYRKTGRRHMYMVKWLNFEHPTWEPIENLENSLVDLILSI